jgi:hypothetical protein
MRKLSLLTLAGLTLGVVGCGGKNGPAEPVELSVEQIEAANQEQKKVEDAERAHQRADPSSSKRPVDLIDEEVRRARGGG